MSEIACRDFSLGVNYWPARTAMGWWPAFDQSEVSADFERISAAGFGSVRIFLTWEDFQPTAKRVDTMMVGRLISTLDEAEKAGLRVMPTLFTGHMSGVNWIPPWALGCVAGDERFRVVSNGAVTTSRLASWYSDDVIVHAQTLLAGELASAVAGHSTLWAWDLGNENSNCGAAPDKTRAKDWLSAVTNAIRESDSRALVTIGLHMEDLEHDRNLGPHEAAQVCDFLTMHGYPGYATWTDGPCDERLLPFLARLTRWLGGGAEVLFSEFGVPTRPAGVTPTRDAGSQPLLVDEDSAAAYTGRALQALDDAGCLGAMLWCYSDYVPSTWQHPPLDLAVHERSFGLWRADASAKPAVASVTEFASRQRRRKPSEHQVSRWLDLSATEFYREPELHLPRLFRRFCTADVAQHRLPGASQA